MVVGEHRVRTASANASAVVTYASFAGRVQEAPAVAGSAEARPSAAPGRSGGRPVARFFRVRRSS